ncbi:MAG: MoaD/ThiS family protein [Alphaproteobacteria bacterium]|nr:MoaD/ThiS family protein [Alphaproteobacteria bacterium]
MDVTLKMSGLIARYVPGSAAGTTMHLLDGTTISGLMARLGLPGDETHLVIVNDSTIAKQRYGTHVLSDGDRISIVSPLKGG